MDEHKLIAEGEVLQQQLVATERGIPFWPQPVFLSKSSWREVPVKANAVGLPGQAHVQGSLTLGQHQVQLAADRCIRAEIETQVTEVSMGPVRLRAAGKAHP
ncbi:hypothetical protein D3C76_1356500 [compost metagenome]